jgi:hypothetical protein
VDPDGGWAYALDFPHPQLGNDAVVPGTRVKGIRTSSSTDSDGGTETEYFDPHMRGKDRTGG